MAFQRKFQNGDRVILSNPIGNNKQYLNQEFTVTEYDGDTIPYRIQSISGGWRIWVRTKEISAAPVTAKAEITQEEPEDKINTSEWGKPEEKKVKKVNFGEVAIAEMQISERDKVKVGFIPNKTMAETLGFQRDLINYLDDYRITKLSKYLENEGTVKTVYSDYIQIQFDNGESEYFPAVGIKVVKHSLTVATFQASNSRHVTVTNTDVFIDGQTYSFDFFEDLYKVIKEHIKEGKRGKERKIPLECSWENGILRDNHIQVGCQRFTYENVRRLIAAIRVARSL